MTPHLTCSKRYWQPRGLSETKINGNFNVKCSTTINKHGDPWRISNDWCTVESPGSQITFPILIS